MSGELSPFYAELVRRVNSCNLSGIVGLRNLWPRFPLRQPEKKKNAGDSVGGDGEIGRILSKAGFGCFQLTFFE